MVYHEGQIPGVVDLVVHDNQDDPVVVLCSHEASCVEVLDTQELPVVVLVVLVVAYPVVHQGQALSEYPACEQVDDLGVKSVL